MKNLIITAAALLMGASAFAQSANTNSDAEFQKYISKEISNKSSFVKDNVQGTITVKVNMTANGVGDVNVVSGGVNPKIDQEVVSFIKNTPATITNKMTADKSVTVLVPIKFVLNEDN